MKVTEVAKGQKFTILGVEYIMVRVTGERTKIANRNQWGRSTGGFHEGDKVVVKTNMRHRGWSAPHYLAVSDGYPAYLVE